MAGGGRIGGQGNLVQRVIWVFVASCIVIAVWNSFPHNPKGFYGELGHKSEQLRGVAGEVRDWVVGVVDDADGKKSTKESAKGSAKGSGKGSAKEPVREHRKGSGEGKPHH